MKKLYVPVVLLLLAIAGFGCSKKTESGAVDSTGAPLAGKPKADVNGTALIMPPSAVTQPIQVSTQPDMNPDQVTFTANFVGSQVQSVTVSGGPGGAVTLTPTDPSTTQQAPAAGMNIRVMPMDAPGSSYNAVLNNPNLSPNLTGNDVTTYSDAMGNSVKITISAIDPRSAAGGTR